MFYEGAHVMDLLSYDDLIWSIFANSMSSFLSRLASNSLGSVSSSCPLDGQEHPPLIFLSSS